MANQKIFTDELSTLQVVREDFKVAGSKRYQEEAARKPLKKLRAGGGLEEASSTMK